MTGMDRHSGRSLSGCDHVWQSVQNILTTPVGSRVMRRDYGSRIFELLDAPLTSSTISAITAATAEALLRWEPRIRLQRVDVSRGRAGQLLLTLTGLYTPDGSLLKLDGIDVH